MICKIRAIQLLSDDIWSVTHLWHSAAVCLVCMIRAAATSSIINSYGIAVITVVVEISLPVLSQTVITYTLTSLSQKTKINVDSRLCWYRLLSQMCNIIADTITCSVPHVSFIVKTSPSEIYVCGGGLLVVSINMPLVWQWRKLWPWGVTEVHKKWHQSIFAYEFLFIFHGNYALYSMPYLVSIPR